MARYDIKGVDLAKELKVSNNSISNLKRSKTMPQLTGDRLNSLCNALSRLSKENEPITPGHLIDWVYDQEAGGDR